jgi:hypothetical protein
MIKQTVDLLSGNATDRLALYFQWSADLLSPPHNAGVEQGGNVTPSIPDVITSENTMLTI